MEEQQSGVRVVSFVSVAARRLAACLLALTALSACSRGTSGPTLGALAVVVASDMTLPRDLDHVGLQATQSGKTLLTVDQDLGPGALLVPATFTIKATSDTTPVTIQAVGYQAGVARVERTAVTPFPAGRDSELRLLLNYLCVGTAAVQADGSVASTCPGGSTCVQGTCQSTTVPSGSLPAADPGGAGGAGGASDVGCFDVQSCFAGAAAAVIDAATCTLTLPAGADPSTVNLALQLPAGSRGVCSAVGCWVVLDQGADWTATAGGVVQLPLAACKASAATVVVTTACHAKTEPQPLCGPWSSVMMPAPQPMMTTPPTPIGQSCAGASAQACGLCGVQARTCVNGEWSAWSGCTGEGACLPGSTGACGTNGTQTCGADCRWGACGCPAGATSCAGTCTSIQDDAHNCGQCGYDCTSLPHVAAGAASCVAGRCAFSCEGGYADCGQTGKGCAASLTTATSCGTCGVQCGGSTPACGPVSSAAGGAGGSATGGAGGASYACVSTCSSPAPTLCGGSCVDLATSPESCGKCGASCPDSASCAGGQCACPDATALCGGRCADLSSETANCGGCGLACPDGAACVKGSCQCVGQPSRGCGACGTQIRTCTDARWSDWTTCSGVGACTPGTNKACTNGTQTCETSCQWSTMCQCQPGAQTCGNDCVDLQTSPANCGACKHACPAASSTSTGLCVAGACTCNGMAIEACGTKCGVQTRTCSKDGAWSAWSACGDERDCTPGDSMACSTTTMKTCGTACTWGSCGCDAGLTSCTNQCVNLQSDLSNCGGCGKACATGRVCQSGTCACASGTTPCGTACVNEKTDSANCGGCGVACTGGMTCQSGTCGCPSGTTNCGASCAATCPAATITSGEQPDAVAIDGSFVYWDDTQTSVIKRAPIGGGAKTTFATAASVRAMAIDASNLYWAGGNVVMKAPLAGGAPVQLASASFAIGLAVDATTVYWANQSSIAAVPIAGGAARTLASGFTVQAGLAIDSANVYWTSYDTANPTTGRIMKVSKAGGTASIIASGSFTAASLATVIATDGTFVYWGTNGSGTNALMKVPVAGGTPVVMVSGAAAGVVLSSTSIYWTSFGSNVHKMPLAGGTITTIGGASALAFNLAIGPTHIAWNDIGSVFTAPR